MRQCNPMGGMSHNRAHQCPVKRNRSNKQCKRLRDSKIEFHSQREGRFDTTEGGGRPGALWGSCIQCVSGRGHDHFIPSSFNRASEYARCHDIYRADRDEPVGSRLERTRPSQSCSTDNTYD